MATEINWGRSDYESRIDARADDIDAFVTAVLGTVDLPAARASPPAWAVVCRYFAGCARAARAQGATPRGGGKRIAAHFARAFPCDAEGSNDAFFEFMDWLARPDEFRPSALRAALNNR
jgi:hypothetical protein